EPVEAWTTGRTSTGHRQASSVFPPITLRQPRALDFILVARGTAVGAAAPDEEELQRDPGGETAHVRPPGYASHIARSRQRQSATEHLAQRPESEIGYRRQLEEEWEEQNRNDNNHTGIGEKEEVCAHDARNGSGSADRGNRRMRVCYTMHNASGKS